MWALSIKSELGDVWHKERISAAGEVTCFCDYRIRLDTKNSRSDPPVGSYVCKRCLALVGRPDKPFEPPGRALTRLLAEMEAKPDS